ncbi:MAG TPA: phosphate ABC transporter substrate-binding protein PstS [Jatrophihabitantaceae bacterium]|nr:phosphate ABC transporter substrate-binding protein PstS [Jatrophihabitantaceae bacterium]
MAAALLAGALALAACGSDKNSSDNPSTTPAGGSTTTASSSGTGGACASGSLKAEGSTAQTNAIQQWIQDFKKQCSGATIDYNPTGSGAGVKQFTGDQVDIGGSDSALDPKKGEVAAAEKRCGGPALNLPMVTGPVAVAFKLSGVTDLTLTPSVIAKIFQGSITSWDDPAIKGLNSGASLPSTKITVFFRSDESGTTQNFEKYLAAAAPADYTAEPSKTWSGKTGQGKSKSQGVQQALSSTEGGIGYLEWSFAGSAGLSMAKVDNGGGAVALDADTAGKAVSAAKITGTGDDLTLKLDYATKVPGAYPIILVTYEIVCAKYSDAAKGSLVKSFLTYTAGPGQAGLKDLGYAPLPADIDAKVQASVAKIS